MYNFSDPVFLSDAKKARFQTRVAEMNKTKFISMWRNSPVFSDKIRFLVEEVERFGGLIKHPCFDSIYSNCPEDALRNLLGGLIRDDIGRLKSRSAFVRRWKQSPNFSFRVRVLVEEAERADGLVEHNCFDAIFEYCPDDALRRKVGDMLRSHEASRSDIIPMVC